MKTDHRYCLVTRFLYLSVVRLFFSSCNRFFWNLVQKWNQSHPEDEKTPAGRQGQPSEETGKRHSTNPNQQTDRCLRRNEVDDHTRLPNRSQPIGLVIWNRKLFYI